MLHRGFILSILLLCTCLGGCAGGPKFSEIADQIPPLPQGQGRIYFYREGSAFGSAIQPSIMLNDQPIGSSVPGGFFYVDQPPGECVVACSTEAEHRLSLHLDPGDKRYVRTSITFGLFVGQVHPVLEDETDAMKTLASTSYTGDKFTPKKPTQ